MHPAVLSYVGRWATDAPIDILDIGGRYVNGTPRHLFPNARYLSIDRRPGRGVDSVVDATIWRPFGTWWDLVLCLEVFEHTDQWPALVHTATIACIGGGRLIVTCAGPGRKPHSAIDGGPVLYPGEWYQNIAPEILFATLQSNGWEVQECRQVGDDVQATAVKPS